MGLDLAALEKGEVELVLGFEVVEGEAAEIGDEDEPRNLVPAILAGEVFNVGEGLGGREAEVFAARRSMAEVLPLRLRTFSSNEAMEARRRPTTEERSFFRGQTVGSSADQWPVRSGDYADLRNPVSGLVAEAAERRSARPIS